MITDSRLRMTMYNFTKVVLSAGRHFHFLDVFQGTFTFLMFFKSELLTCGQKVPISWRWLRVASWGFLRI